MYDIILQNMSLQLWRQIFASKVNEQSISTTRNLCILYLSVMIQKADVMIGPDNWDLL